jgi:hypothetical protein
MPDDDPWRVIRELRQDIRELRADLDNAHDRIRVLERQTPEARQLQYEADLAAVDLAESGYDDRPSPIGADRHGPSCQCPYCPGESEPDDYDDYDPGPECDDQGGMTERLILLPDEPIEWSRVDGAH